MVFVNFNRNKHLIFFLILKINEYKNLAIKINIIIEGSDVEIETHFLKIPFEKSELENLIEELESECDYYWKLDNLDNCE